MQYADIQFRVELKEAGRLPPFVGVTLRGALGYRLKRRVCVVDHKQCNRCLLSNSCAFPALFEGRPPQNRSFMRKYDYVPQPFAIRADSPPCESFSPGMQMDFTIRLFGSAIAFYPYLVVTVIDMGIGGLGRDRIPFEVVEISDGQNSLQQEDALVPPTANQAFVSRQEQIDSNVRLRLNLQSPVRLRVGGEYARQPSLSDLVRAAIRRIRVLSHFYSDEEIAPSDLDRLLDSVESVTPIESNLRWYEIQRQSKRQQTRMTLGGVVGHVEYVLPDSDAIPWLKAAEALHIGKATSFGFGRINVSWEVL